MAGSSAHLYRADVQPDPRRSHGLSDVQQLIDASRLYYELGETQSRVAELLGVTRPQVSRILKRARAEGIVEIRIVDQAAQSSRRRRRAARAVRPPGRPPRGEPPAGPRTSAGGWSAGLARTCCGPRSATAGSSASATGRRSPPLADALDEPLARDRRDRRPAVRRLLVQRPGPRAVPADRRRDRRRAPGPPRPGPRRRPGHEALARRPRRRAPDPRSLGPARRRRRSGSAGRPGATAAFGTATCRRARDGRARSARC